MNRTIFKKQIPTLLALLILFIGAGAGVVLVGSGAGFLPRAGPEYTPKQVKLTNLSDKSFTVTWLTDEATTGFIRYGATTALGTTISDDRDQLSGQTNNYSAHHVTVRGLTASTTYYFNIGSGPNTTLFDNNGQPYQVTTGQTLGTPNNSETTYGKVVTKAETPASGAIIMLSIDGASPLSAIISSTGSWALPLSSIRTADLSKYFSYDQTKEIIKLDIFDNDGLITSGVTNTNNDQPVPTITLGESFDFNQDSTKSHSPKSLLPTPTPSSTASAQLSQRISDANTATSSGFNLSPLSSSPTQTSTVEVELYNPSYDGEQINTTQPEFQGSAPANTRIFIKVESPQIYEDELITDSLGDFEWTPPTDLEPGDHTITISYLDENGIEQFFKRHFVVLAQGESNIPALTSSPSATPRPTLTPTPSPRVSPSLSPTPQATTSGRVSQPSTASGVPTAGVSFYTFTYGLIGFLLIVIGFGLSRQLPIENRP